MSYARGDPYRSSAGSVDLAYRDGPPGGGRGGGRRFVEEEETDRYESYRGGGNRYEEERETDRIDYSNGRSGGRPHRGSVSQRDVEIDISRERERGGRPRRSQYYEEDDYERESSSPPRSVVAPQYGGGRERQQAIVIERDRRGPPPIPRGSARPGGPLRRQSSLDTFDRKPRPRYHEDEEEIDIHASFSQGPRREEYRPPRGEFRPPPNVPIPLPRPRRSPPRYEERDFEEIRIAEPDFYGDEGYHRRGGRRGGGRPRSGSRFEESIEIDERETERRFPRRGKTKVPRRLIDPRAAIQLGYPFEEEGEFIVIKLALGNEQIDEIITISERYRKDEVETIRIEERRMLEAPPPPQLEIIEQQNRFEESIGPRQPQIIQAPPAPPPQIIKLPANNQSFQTEIFRSPPVITSNQDSWEIATTKSDRNDRESESISIHESRSRRGSRSRRRSSSPKREIIEESSNRISGPLGIFNPDRRKSDRDIKAEIRALDAEKKALKLERRSEKEAREAERYRDRGRHRRSKSERRSKSHGHRRGVETEVEEVSVQRDRKGSIRERDREPDPRLIRLAMGTLT